MVGFVSFIKGFQPSKEKRRIFMAVKRTAVSKTVNILIRDLNN